MRLSYSTLKTLYIVNDWNTITQVNSSINQLRIKLTALYHWFFFSSHVFLSNPLFFSHVELQGFAMFPFPRFPFPFTPFPVWMKGHFESFLTKQSSLIVDSVTQRGRIHVFSLLIHVMPYKFALPYFLTHIYSFFFLLEVNSNIRSFTIILTFQTQIF